MSPRTCLGWCGHYDDGLSILLVEQRVVEQALEAADDVAVMEADGSVASGPKANCGDSAMIRGIYLDRSQERHIPTEP